MAAKETPIPGSVVVETAGISLHIGRNPMATLPPTVRFDVQLSYGDSTYLVDGTGKKVKLMAANENHTYIPFDEAKVMALFMTPMKEADGTDTVLGEFLSKLWDAEINNHIAAQIAANK